MLRTHTQLTALGSVSGLTVLLCALLLGEMLYGSDLGLSSPIEATEMIGTSSFISEVKLTASDGKRYDYFAQSVSIDGDRALLGAPYDDEKGLDAGAAYIFRWDGERWQEEEKLLADAGAQKDYFGQAVSISGEVALVGASEAAYIFRWDGKSWQEEEKLLASDGDGWDEFGSALALSGDMALVGAPREEAESDEALLGSVYVYRFDGESWQEEDKLLPSDGAESLKFGFSLSLSNEVALVGTDGRAAYLFRWDGNAWQEETKLTSDKSSLTHKFGWRVSVNGDLAVVGATELNYGYEPEPGAAYIYRFDGKEWQEEAILASGLLFDGFAQAVSLSESLLIVTAQRQPYDKPATGMATIYRFDGSSWQEEAKLVGNVEGKFGHSIALSGEQLLIGVPGDDDSILGGNVGAAHLYDLSSQSAPDIALSASSIRGVTVEGVSTSQSLSLKNNGTEALFWSLSEQASWASATPISGTVAPEASQAIRLELDGTALTWGSYTDTLVISSNDRDESRLALPLLLSVTKPKSEVKLTASDKVKYHGFGSSVSVGEEYAVVGFNNYGSAYFFHWDGKQWQEQQKIEPSIRATHNYFGYFGGSVSLTGELALIGAFGDDQNGTDSGAAYIYRWNGSQWEEESRLLASDGALRDQFGYSVSMSEQWALVGAPGYTNDYGTYLGAAYFFRWNGSSWVEAQKLVSNDSNGDGNFGISVSLSGDLALIGAYKDDENGSHAGAAYLFRWDGSRWQEEEKLLASDGDYSDYFGRSVSLFDDVAFVSAPGQYENGSKGAVHVYRFDGSSWREEQKLQVIDQISGETFGSSVSLYGDAALIGISISEYTESAGAAYLFRWNGQKWQQEAKLEAGDGALQDQFGSSVSLYGERAAVGASGKDDSLVGPNIGAAYLYDLAPGNVPEITLNPTSMKELIVQETISTKTLTISNNGTEALQWRAQSNQAWLTSHPSEGTIAPNSELSVTLQLDAATLLAGPAYTSTLTITSNDPDEASIEVPLEMRAMIPTQEFKLPAGGDIFGYSISVSDKLALVGAPGDAHSSHIGTAHLFGWDGQRWQEQAILHASDEAKGDRFGYALALSGDLAVIGAPGDDEQGTYSGSAYIYRWNGSSWVEEGKLLPSDGMERDGFGASVALSGNVALVGARRVAYIFRWNGSHWVEESKIEPENSTSYFPSSLDIDGDVAIIGDHLDAEHGMWSGAAYLFRFDGAQWLQEAKLSPSNTNPYRWFGSSVSVKGNLALVGESANSETYYRAGAAYIFRWTGESWQEEGKLLADDGTRYDYFGHEVSIDGNLALIGASANNGGAAYLFGWNGERWQQKAKLTASDGGVGDRFGSSVSLSNSMALVGAAHNAYAYELLHLSNSIYLPLITTTYLSSVVVTPKYPMHGNLGVTTTLDRYVAVFLLTTTLTDCLLFPFGIKTSTLYPFSGSAIVGSKPLLSTVYSGLNTLSN